MTWGALNHRGLRHLTSLRYSYIRPVMAHRQLDSFEYILMSPESKYHKTGTLKNNISKVLIFPSMEQWLAILTQSTHCDAIWTHMEIWRHQSSTWNNVDNFTEIDQDIYTWCEFEMEKLNITATAPKSRQCVKRLWKHVKESVWK